MSHRNQHSYAVNYFLEKFFIDQNADHIFCELLAQFFWREDKTPRFYSTVFCTAISWQSSFRRQKLQTS
jgi:hypothetical protein